MRRSASEKQEIIHLVEHTDLPVRVTLRQLGIAPSTFYGWYQRYLEGGFDAAKRLTEKAVKEMVPAEEPRQKVDLTKVYGGGQEIPFKVPEGSTSPGPARTHAD